MEDPRRLAAVEVGRENGLTAAGGPRREEGLMGAGTNLLLWRVNPGGGMTLDHNAGSTPEEQAGSRPMSG